MKEIEVIIKDENTLVLKENGNVGDIINLQALKNVDLTMIDALIKDGKDQVYERRFAEYKKLLEKENEIKITKILNEKASDKQEYDSLLASLKKDNENNLKNQRASLDIEYKSKINVLQNTIESIKNEGINNLKIKEAELNAKHISEVSELKNKLANADETLKKELEILKQTLTNESLKELETLKESFNKELQKKDEIIHQKEEEFLALQNQRVNANVKQTGEDLESWCNNEVLSYMQNGLDNCTWNKDNEVIKVEGEEKGSKADYIFKVYASSEHKDEDMLASLCLDMKDENPNSKNKKSNQDYYAALDKNRNKKKCKYAILVSRLEMDKVNDLPILKVNEYKDMYVVRPAYLMTFLNMIVSLTNRFKDLLLEKNKNDLTILAKKEFLEEFEQLKLTYLDKPLISLESDVDKLAKENEIIAKASSSINETIAHIINSYIANIYKKLNNFEEKVNKEYKKLDK